MYAIRSYYEVNGPSADDSAEYDALIDELQALVFLIVIGPLQVIEDDLGRVVAPDDAVGGGDHLHRQVEAQHSYNFV